MLRVFSLPPKRYRSCHSFEPPGRTRRVSPPPSASLTCLPSWPGLAVLILVSVSMLHHRPAWRWKMDVGNRFVDTRILTHKALGWGEFAGGEVSRRETFKC